MAAITHEKMEFGAVVRGGKLCVVKRVLEFEGDKLVKVLEPTFEAIDGLPGHLVVADAVAAMAVVQ